MQQTETYKLNKPETSDNFTPAPLNENADKIEAELARVDASAAALAQRVETLELHRIAVGFCSASEIILDFQPKVAIATNGNYTSMAMPGRAVGGSRYATVSITADGYGLHFTDNVMNGGGLYLALA